MAGLLRVGVVGASGKTGRAITDALLAHDVSVTAIGRAQWSDLAGVLGGCAAVSVIAPNFHPDEPAYVAEVLAAAEAAGVHRVVYHSVATPYAPAMPHHLAKARAEDLVRRSSFAWSVVQPCAYVQNLVPLLRSGPGVVEVPYAVDRPFGLVDLVDVAEATAGILLDDGHVGATYELGGPALVTVSDVAAEAGRLLGRPVAAARVGPEVWAAGPGVALDDHEREGLLAMYDYYDRHGFPAGGRVLRALLGGRSTALRETLARELAGVAGPG
jgi:uncharacterized protein YbjT (DUF2867 family)